MKKSRQLSPVWNRRFHLFIGTEDGNAFCGLHLPSSGLDPAATFFEGARGSSGAT
jgi:hypothetical protein